MKYLFMPFRTVFKIYYFIVFVFLLLISFPIYSYYLSDSCRFPKAFKVMRFHSLLLLLFGGFPLKVSGGENIPEAGPYIICPNHSSFLDIFCLYFLFKKYFVFTGKQEIEKWPLFHIFYTSGMNILVDRHSRTGAIKSLKRMVQEIDKGNPLMIFPEGTISKNVPLLGPFKSGAFAIAIQKQIPIIPVTFVNNWRRLQRSGIWKGKAGPGISEIVIHEPVFTSGLNKENIHQLKIKVYEIINGPLKVIPVRSRG